MTAWLIAKAIPYLLGLMALFGLYQRGKHDGEVKATREVMKQYQKTRERMDGVKVGNDPAVLRDWLRERGKS